MATDADQLLAMLKSDGLGKPVLTTTAVAVTRAQTTNVTDDPDEVENLNRIIKAQEQIAEVKRHLNTIIDGIADNPSLLQRATKVWGEASLWQKITTGAVVTMPAFVGLAASVASLVFIGGGAGIVYTSTGLVLQDHYDCSENTKQRLRDGISSIADILGATINSLDEIRVKIAAQIARFKATNDRLNTKVAEFQNDIHAMSIQIGNLTQTGSFLLASKERLERNIADLEKNAVAQKAQLEAARKDLELTIQDYKANQLKLEGEVSRLSEVRDGMTAEVAKSKQISIALQGVVEHLQKQVDENKAQQQNFQAKLTQAAKDDVGAAAVIERLSTTQEELAAAKNLLCANNKTTRELLNRQEQIIQEMEALNLSAVAVVMRPEQLLRKDQRFFPGAVGANSSAQFKAEPVASLK